MKQTPKAMINEVHHWWPITVSQHWADANGVVHRIGVDGKVVSSQPKSFGGIRNDNTIRLGTVPTVCDHSFERSFDKADSSFNSLIGWFHLLPSPICDLSKPLPSRLVPLAVTRMQFETVVECLASLIVRSPCFRARISAYTEHLRDRMGFGNPKPERRLIGMNIRNGQKHVGSSMKAGGKFVVLLSGDDEFIFGDGFFHNISAVNDPPMCPQCLIPVTPRVAIFYSRPVQQRSYPKAFVMSLSAQEVALVNETVQLYSEKYLFYRAAKPVLTVDFLSGEHMRFESDRNHWSMDLAKAMADTSFGDDRNWMAAWAATGE